MNNFKIFETMDEYQKYIGGDYLKPNISLIKTTNEIIFTDLPKVGGTTASDNEALKSFFARDMSTFTIPSGVTKLGRNCFYQCNSLKNIDIPSGVTEFGESCFAQCTALENINIPESVTQLGENCFYQCKTLTNIDIPSGVKKIGNTCFGECESLTNITISETVTELGQYCFYSLPKLKWVKILAKIPPSIKVMTFVTDCPIFVPDESVEKYKKATNWGNQTKNIRPLSSFNESDYTQK